MRIGYIRSNNDLVEIFKEIQTNIKMRGEAAQVTNAFIKDFIIKYDNIDRIRSLSSTNNM